MSWFGSAAKATAGAPAAAAAAEEARRAEVGKLSSRKDVPRAQGDMQAYVTRCLNGELGQICRRSAAEYMYYKVVQGTW